VDRKASDWERQKAHRNSTAGLAGANHHLEGGTRTSPSGTHDAIQNETDRRLIIGIDSDTDHLPVGVVRDLSAADALIEKDIQIARAEAHCKAAFLDICKRIVKTGTQKV
jgi:hypothetical protein